MRFAIAVFICLAAHAFQFFLPALKGRTFSAKDAVNSSATAEAVAASTRYLALNPTSEEAICVRAGAWWTAKRFKESARDARAVLTLNPWNEHARDLLILDLEGLGRLRQAQAETERWVALQSMVARLADDIRHGRYNAAEGRITAHLNAYPRDVRALYVRATLRRLLRRFGPSSKDARAALAVVPWNRDSGLRWILIGNLVNESSYWEAFREIRILQSPAEEEKDSLRQVRQTMNAYSSNFPGATGGPYEDLVTLYDRLSTDLAFSEISHGISVTTKQQWLWRSSEWFTIFAHWIVVLAQILMIGIYCGHFTVKRTPPIRSGPIGSIT